MAGATEGLGGQAVAKTELKHVASSLINEKTPRINPELVELAKIRKQADGKTMFEASLAEKEEDNFVNFAEIDQVVAAEGNAARQARLQLKRDVYDKFLNNDLTSLTGAEALEIRKAMTALPGFCESVSYAMAGTVLPDQIKQLMEGGGGVVLTGPQSRVLMDILNKFASDDRLRSRIAKSLSTLELPAEDAVKVQQIADLRDGVRDEAAKRAALATVNGTITAFEAQPPGTQDRITKIGRDTDKWLGQLEDAYKPNTLTLADITNAETTINTAVAAANAAYLAAAGGAAGAATQFAELQKLTREQAVVVAMKTAYTVGTAAADYASYQNVESARAKKANLDAEVKKIEKDKTQIAQLEGERNRYAGKYKAKLDTTLGEAMKRYWNEVILAESERAATAEANKTEQKKAEEATEQEKRVADAHKLLDTFTHRLFFKYKNGKPVGFDDRKLKDFVKKDMLSRSPAQMSRELLEQIFNNRHLLPPEYGNEIQKVFEGMGLGKGTPAATLRNILDKIDQGKYEEWAAEKVPDLLGYAWHRGYYFDRLRLKPGQAEFLKQAYSPEFFATALNKKAEYIKAAEEMFGQGILEGGAINAHKLKKIIGDDWTEGSKRLMRLLAVTGGAAAGAFVLGGGLAVPGSQAVFPFNTTEALRRVANTGALIADAGVRTAQAASSVSQAALGGVASGIIGGSNFITGAINP